MKKESAKTIKVSEVAPKSSDRVDRDKYMKFLKIYHRIRPYVQKENNITKADLIKLFPKEKKMVESVWTCVNELKLIWAKEIFDRLD